MKQKQGHAHGKKTAASSKSKDQCHKCNVPFPEDDDYCLICGSTKRELLNPKGKGNPRPSSVKQPNPSTPTRASGGTKQDSPSLTTEQESHVAQLSKLWVPDNFSTECMDCCATFGFSNRRHHCRVCGLLFDKKCVSNKMVVPGSFGYGNTPQRCCNHCTSLLTRRVIRTPQDVFTLRKMPGNTPRTQGMLPGNSRNPGNSNSGNPHGNKPKPAGDAGPRPSAAQLAANAQQQRLSQQKIQNQNRMKPGMISPGLGLGKQQQQPPVTPVTKPVTASNASSSNATAAASVNSSFVNHYQILDVHPQASAREIMQRYKAQSKGLTPNSSAHSKKEWTQLKEAYSVLSNLGKRREYDVQLARAITAERQQRQAALAPSLPTSNPKSSQDECQVCFRPFNKLARRAHHCRRCTRSVCNPCSEQTKAIPEFGFDTGVRHCKTCLTSPPSLMTLRCVRPRASSSSDNNEKDFHAPPTGMEYLSELEIHASLDLVKDDKKALDNHLPLFSVHVFTSVGKTSNDVSPIQRETVENYRMSLRRSASDFEWFFQSLGQLTNAKALPAFAPRPGASSSNNSNNDGQYPSQSSISSDAMEKYRAAMEIFIKAVMMHPALNNLDPTRAFLGLADTEFEIYRRKFSTTSKSSSVGTITTTRGSYHDLASYLQLKLAEAQLSLRLETLRHRKVAHLERVNAQKRRMTKEATRFETQRRRSEANEVRLASIARRETQQAARMAREALRFENQKKSDHIVFSDYHEDERVRNLELNERELAQAEFIQSKDAFQADTLIWNSDMAAWCAHRTEWSHQNNPPASRQMALDWIVAQYGVEAFSGNNSATQGETSSSSSSGQLLASLNSRWSEILATEPTYLESESDLIDEEWTALATERECWVKERRAMQSEQAQWNAEDTRFQTELDHVQRERRLRKEKVEKIEVDLTLLEQEVMTRGEALDERRVWHEALQEDYGQWSEMQKQRHLRTQERLGRHGDRIDQALSRKAILTAQYSRQHDVQRVLNFQGNDELARERETDKQEIAAAEEASKEMVGEALSEKSSVPEIIQRLETDLEIRDGELTVLKGSNKATHFENGEDIDERDEYMLNVRRRRQRFQEHLNNQEQLLTKGTFVISC